MAIFWCESWIRLGACTCATRRPKKDGKVHRYWRLVRSVRVGRRVIQQTVAQLGELDARGRLQARALARRLIGTPEQAGAVRRRQQHVTVPVRLKGVRIERSRQFGDVYLALALWRGIGLGDLCEQLLPLGQGARAVGEDGGGAGGGAAVRAVERAAHCRGLVSPHGALRSAAACRCARSTRIGCIARSISCCRTRRAGGALSQRCGELFAVENEVLLYDVTSTYFEGEAEANPLAQRGYSRDHRPDCKQVCIALVVTFDGFPSGLRGVRRQHPRPRTVQTIVSTMEARHGVLGRVWIADRGMASAANLAWLRQTGRRYIIGAPKAELRKFAAELAAADGWRAIRDGVEVKLAR